MSDEPPKIASLDAARINKVIKESGEPVLGGPVPPGGEVVSVLGCINCGSTEFRLGHYDPIKRKEANIVFCAKCCVAINSLRWYDVNRDPPPSAPAA